jgi:hypothetical protein
MVAKRETEMKSHAYRLGPMELRNTSVQSATLALIAATVLASLFCTAAHAQPDQAFMDRQEADAANCRLYGCGNSNSNSNSWVPRVDPCTLRQNAMIPCNSAPAKPPEVDLTVVGTWELMLQGGPWVLEIRRDGTYTFHSEARDGAASHAGTFSASNGRWSLIADSGYRDWGTYVLQGQDTWIATGHLGIGAWRRLPQQTASSQP